MRTRVRSSSTFHTRRMTLCEVSAEAESRFESTVDRMAENSAPVNSTTPTGCR